MKKQILAVLGILLWPACAPISSPSLSVQKSNAIQSTAPVSNGYTGPIVIKIDTALENTKNPNPRVLTLKQVDPLNAISLAADEFDPRQPASLEKLKPNEGDLGDSSKGETQIGKFLLTEHERDNPGIPFVSGELTLEFKNPKTDLPVFQRLYGGTVRDISTFGDSQFYYIKLDLERCPVDKIEELARKFCRKFNRDIRGITVSSWTAFRTFIMEMDMLVNQDNIIKSVSVNGVSEMELISVPAPTPRPSSEPTANPTPTPSQ